VRNSLFVSTSVSSLKKLMDTLKCHPALPNFDYPLRVSTSPCAKDTNAYFYSVAKPDPAWSTFDPADEPMNQSTALKLLNKEAAELEKRMAEASSFRKYPGVSWPVNIGVAGATSNYACFEYVRLVPKIIPPLSDSVYGIRMVADEFRDSARLEMARHVNAALRPDARDGLA
jgi:hypothetical protein